MLTINKCYSELKENYLFAEIAHRVNSYSKENPDKKVIKMGIGDVTRPLCQAVVDAMKTAAEEMADAETFHGYGPEQGYDFLREAVKKYYASDKINIELDEIFISDGAKSDLGNILDILGKDNTVLIPDPVYPVYVDTNIMDGRKIVFASASKKNDFLAMPDAATEADIIYLCSPNNPTGAVYSREQLGAWISFALKKKALILFDSAYEAFISDDSLPGSIYSIPGAKKCAIEFCSLSKTAGFTGTRCGYTIVPKELKLDGALLNKLWLRRQTTKFNGVSYVIQRAAAAALSSDGLRQIKENIAYYRRNAKVITQALDNLGIYYTGGKNSPYIWLRCPNDMNSWEFFDLLLSKANVVGTPGAGFGKNGEKYFRLTAFSDYANTCEAMKRLKSLLSGKC